MLLQASRAGLSSLQHLHAGTTQLLRGRAGRWRPLQHVPPLPPPAPLLPPPARQAGGARVMHASASSRGRDAASHTAEPQEQPAAEADSAAAAPAGQPAPLCSTTTALGQVMAAQANFVRVKVDELVGGAPGEAPPRARLLCVVRALLKKMRREVLVGDRVRLVGVDWVDGRGMVEEVLPRASRLAEPAVANVDHVLLVFSAAMPAFQPSPATRYLLAGEAAWLPVTVAVNKADLLSPEEVEAVVGQIASWGYRAVAVSVVSGQGLEELTQVLRGRVTVVAGPSGAGKSSIINALRLRSRGLEAALGAMAGADPTGAEADAPGCSSDEDEAEEVEEERRQDGAQPPAAAEQQQHQQQQQQQQRRAGARSDYSSSSNGAGPAASAAGGAAASAPAAAAAAEAAAAVAAAAAAGAALPADLELQAVGNVSQRIGRGKHTTRNVTLIELEGSGGPDRPSGGLVVDTPGFNQPDLAGLPAGELAQHFPEIRALLEEQRCAFRGCQHLQEPGCVVREAGWERYPLYAELHAELKAAEEVEKARQASKKKREGTARVKSRAGGQTGVEARLETKAHRRVSRRSVRQRLADLVKDVDDADAVF